MGIGLWSIGCADSAPPASTDQPLRRYTRMPNYLRLQGGGGTFFFTVALADRSNRLLVDHVDLVRAAFAETKLALPFAIDAIVILPDHLHCIWTLPDGNQDVPSRWASIKAGVSRRLPRTETLSRSRAARRERGIWQRRFWEHVIEDDEDFRTHLDYIHYNPVKHGHARCAGDWPFSSFHRYVRSGVYPVDWADTAVAKQSFGEAV